MQLAKSIYSNFTQSFYFSIKPNIKFFTIVLVSVFSQFSLYAQDNSPYSRYGLGNLVPNTNISSRAMGGISTTYTDYFTINYSNPAALGSMQAVKEGSTKKMDYGRAILDIGINIDNRKLSEPNKIGKFTAYNTVFSHLQIAMPLHTKWGLTFGLRPITHIKYNVSRNDAIKNPQTGNIIDSVQYKYEGSGGSYYANMGIGHKFLLGKNSTISLGISSGYLFGQKEINSYIFLRNDSVNYQSGKYQTKTSFGNVFTIGGFLFQTVLKNKYIVSLGGYGNSTQKLKAKQDLFIETAVVIPGQEDVRLDSVISQIDKKGNITYPSDFSIGFSVEKLVTTKSAGFMYGVDYQKRNWKEYSYYNEPNTTNQNSWTLKTGLQLKPIPKENKYFSFVSYRAGFFIGNDILNIQNKNLPVLGASIGFGLPILNYSRLSVGGANVLNTSFEFIKRGNTNSLLKENLFRISLGFAVSDLWFYKKKYD